MSLDCTRVLCLKKFELFFAGFPKLSGRQPEPNCGERQNDREASNDAFVVTFEHSVDRFEGGDYAGMEGGAVFFVIVIGGRLSALGLHQAQR
jgi:hypothetical protein